MTKLFDKLYKALLVACCIYMVLASAYKIGYKFGSIDSCMSIYNGWYQKLDIKNIDQGSLAQFCKERTQEK